MNNYKPVIGLEIHVELKTKSKMFCQCSANYFGKDPNTNTCPVCLGMPGALPVPNKKAIEWIIKLGLALGCKINTISKFDRKHYSYPDLPKGYQISQFDEPFCQNGFLVIGSEAKQSKFRITRIHMEEDTGKLIHSGQDTLVDFNRSGVPLVEIVTEPDFDNSDDVKAFLQELYTIIKYLDISDADMEKGSMRMEPNISVRKIDLSNSDSIDDNVSHSGGSPGQAGFPNRSKQSSTEITDSMHDFELPKYKVEVKNINSFRYVKQAIDYDVKRQIEILEKGETPLQETRGFDEKKVATYAQRVKEEAADYRYFPEPDIPPIRLTDEQILDIKKVLPELPQQKVERYMSQLHIKESDAMVITRNISLMYYFEKVCSENKESNKKLGTISIYQTIANNLINKIDINKVSPNEAYKQICDDNKPKETNRDLLNEVATKIILSNQKSVEDYKSGKTNAIMFLVGQVMKEMKGQADAQDVKKKLEEELS